MWSWSTPPPRAPAAWTTPWIAPKRRRTSSRAAATAARSVMSAASGSTSAPASCSRRNPAASPASPGEQGQAHPAPLGQGSGHLQPQPAGAAGDQVDTVVADAERLLRAPPRSCTGSQTGIQRWRPRRAASRSPVAIPTRARGGRVPPEPRQRCGRRRPAVSQGITRHGPAASPLAGRGSSPSRPPRRRSGRRRVSAAGRRRPRSRARGPALQGCGSRTPAPPQNEAAGATHPRCSTVRGR